MEKINQQIQTYLEYCEKIRCMSATTMGAKRNVLKRFVACTGVKDLQKLDNKTFNIWVKNETERGVSPRSINTYNSVILAMVRYYRECGLKVPLNITLIGKLREGSLRRKYYTADEIKHAVAHAGPEVGLMIKIMFETGMRIAELTRLKITDFNGRRIKFIGKGNKPREVYITNTTLAEVQKYIRKYRPKNYLWGVSGGMATINGEPPTTNTIREHLKEAFMSAGFEGFYPHALRHSFATDLQLKGASVEEIKEMIGHESVATTERYLHGFDGQLEALFDKYQRMQVDSK